MLTLSLAWFPTLVNESPTYCVCLKQQIPLPPWETDPAFVTPPFSDRSHRSLPEPCWESQGSALASGTRLVTCMVRALGEIEGLGSKTQWPGSQESRPFSDSLEVSLAFQNEVPQTYVLYK